MSEESATLLNSALALPERERKWLIQQLLQSLSPQQTDEVDEEFLEELNRRAAEADDDSTSLVPWSEVQRMS